MTSSIRMASKQLHRVIANPAKVASALDWKQAKDATVLTMTLHTDRIGLAVASHPASCVHQQASWSGRSLRSASSHGPSMVAEPQDSALQVLPSIPLTGKKRTRVPAGTVKELKTLMDQYNVCGVVLSWPLQEDTARMGANCGRALHTLDQLLLASDDDDVTGNSSPKSSSDIISNNIGECSNGLFSSSSRPVCFWTSQAVDHEGNREDGWSRCRLYAGSTDADAKPAPAFHMASIEQYHQKNENIVAVQVWDDFCRTHWPQLSEYMPAMPSAALSRERNPEPDERALAHSDENDVAIAVTTMNAATTSSSTYNFDFDEVDDSWSTYYDDENNNLANAVAF
eukprot:CAMPEP_0119570112 /NCGR_PEP_ID=MMETSP1352-20130426/43448_1 /TAXON_ID=265584 /ORGANISM="Stauroneis constricta, Strain CCMP1120" /LENGTH=340 /DNA_ID=CAMNT_0007619777 /DNA_START=519 /DNA_END=1541 /DNA_ORIENTATION=+